MLVIICVLLQQDYHSPSLVGPKWVLMQTGPRDAVVTMMHLSDSGLEEIKDKRHNLQSVLGRIYSLIISE